MITKPEDAVPHEFYHYEGGAGMGGRPTVYFTAAECAEIAKAYGDCVAAEMMTQDSHGDEWRAKFAEWEKGQ